MAKGAGWGGRRRLGSSRDKKSNCPAFGHQAGRQQTPAMNDQWAVGSVGALVVVEVVVVVVVVVVAVVVVVVMVVVAVVVVVVVVVVAVVIQSSASRMQITLYSHLVHLTRNLINCSLG
ncbi:hypothetical protein ElyMa_004656000 [Elysia marginata]|uniref:Uncharacterized protein n=1 Tax=Elysia marginata TaxID=1093978 RepID=A0AAV4I4I2_9GAST|nr:hypothetical protein ElyMa_004656000 [Elysia marginata]